MTMETKNAAVEIKTNSTPGEFTAVISAIGNVDRQGDRVMPGAFKSAIDLDPVPPVYWSHLHQIPPIGDGVEWYEQGKEIVYKGSLFVAGDDEHQYAKMVYAGMKSRDGRPPAINQFSYTYGTPEDGTERIMEDGKSIRLLHQIRPVAEVGPCFIGANPATYLAEPAKSAVADLVLARGKGRSRVSMKQLLTDTLGLKDYGDIDGWEIRMLLEMLDSAVSFIQFSDEDDDVLAMQSISNMLLGMLTAEFAEVTDLMAQGEAIDAILSQDTPAAVQTASTDAPTAQLEKKDAVAELEVPAPEVPVAGESAVEETPVAGESAEVPTGESEVGEVHDDETPETPVDAVSSDEASTVSNDEIARLVNTWPSH